MPDPVKPKTGRAAAILGGMTRPSAQSDNTRVSPRTVSTTNNPNLATIGPAPSRARQALNVARTVLPPVDAIASAAEAGISMRKGEAAATIVGLGLVGAAVFPELSAVIRSRRATSALRNSSGAEASAWRIESNRVSHRYRAEERVRDNRATRLYADAGGNPDGRTLTQTIHGPGMSKKSGELTSLGNRHSDDMVPNPRSPISIPPTSRPASPASTARVNARIAAERSAASKPAAKGKQKAPEESYTEGVARVLATIQNKKKK